MSTNETTLKIIDTNVVIESGKTMRPLSIEELECAEKCLAFLKAFIRNPNSGIVLDQGWEILKEYQRNIESEYGKVGLQSGVTGEFWKFALASMAKPPYEDLVNLQKTGENDYAVFPATRP